MIFRSISEFKKHYLPKKYKKELLDKMTPEELGRYMATETMKTIH